MNQILMALATSAALLVPVVVLAILASIAAVRRGEHGLHAGASAPHAPAHGPAAAESEAAPPRRGLADLLPDREPLVLEILLLGVVLFVLAMGILLGFSMLQNLG